MQAPTLSLYNSCGNENDSFFQFIDKINTMNTCFFCGHKPFDDICTIEQPIYRLKHYAHLVVVRKFEYEKQLIPIPRCRDCAAVHLKAKKSRRNSIIIGASVGFVFGLAVPGAFIFTAVIGGAVGLLVATVRAKKRYNKLQIKGINSAAIAQYPLIDAQLKEGWTTKKP